MTNHVDYAPPFGFTIWDDEAYDVEDGEPCPGTGSNWPTEECCRAAAGRLLSALTEHSDLDAEKTTVEIYPDLSGGGWGLDSPGDVMKLGKEHKRGCCPGGVSNPDPATIPFP